MTEQPALVGSGRGQGLREQGILVGVAGAILEDHAAVEAVPARDSRITSASLIALPRIAFRPPVNTSLASG